MCQCKRSIPGATAVSCWEVPVASISFAAAAARSSHSPVCGNEVGVPVGVIVGIGVAVNVGVGAGKVAVGVGVAVGGASRFWESPEADTTCLGGPAHA